jgi:hypothetical protein
MLPQLNAMATTTANGAPIYPWNQSFSDAVEWTSNIPGALSRVHITIDSGCVPGDKLSFSTSTVNNFYGKIQTNSGLCGSPISISGTGSLYEFVSLLETITFTSSSNSFNLASPNLLRVIKFEFENFVSLFSTIQVLSLNNRAPLGLSLSRLSLIEGSPPDFAIAVMRNCPNVPFNLTHGVPTLCFSDPDAPFFRAEEEFDSYAGRFMGPLLMQPASNYTPVFSSLTTNFPCISSWSAKPVGSVVSDCSSANPDAGGTNPINCYWQRYRVVLPKALSFFSGNFTCLKDCSLDFESSCSGGSLAPSTLSSLQFFADLSLLDFELPSYGSSGQRSVVSNKVSLILSVTNAFEPPQLAWPDPASFSAVGILSAPVSPSAPLYIDDTTGFANITTPRMLYCSQDNDSIYTDISFAPLEGPNNMTVVGNSGFSPKAYFKIFNSKLPARHWVKDVPVCNFALSQF